MNNALKWGVILAAVVTVINLVFLAMGLHANPIFSLLAVGLFAIVNIVVIVVALMKSRAEKGYGGQLVQSLLIGVVGGVCIFLASYVMLSFVFPDAIAEAQEGAIAMLESAGLPEAQLEANIEKIEGKTAMGDAIGAIFLRKK